MRTFVSWLPALVLGTAASAQQLTWRELPPRIFRECQMVHDLARDRFVVQTDSTYEWDGTNLLPRRTQHRPTQSTGFGMAYDVLRRRTVLFGGAGSATGEVWEYDGLDWYRITPASGPVQRGAPALTYDLARGVVVVFGGNGFTDTWLWNGASWREVVTPGPSSRSAPAMAFHAGSARTVLFSGGNLADTWTFDGAIWTLEQPATSPPASMTHQLASDVGNNLVRMIGTNDGRIWDWDGVNWSSIWSLPEPRFESGIAADLNGNTLICGGRRVLSPAVQLGLFTRPMGDIWRINGNGPVRVHDGGPAPPLELTLAYDLPRDRVVGYCVMPENLQQTSLWEWDGERWLEMPVAGMPPTIGTRFVFDPVRGQTVHFGGLVMTGFTASFPTELQEWDGTTWSQHSVPGPAGRWQHALTFDSSRAVVLLFGGSSLQATFADTWEWDGVAWTQVATTGPARSSANMTYDGRRGRAVLFGGSSGNTVLGDTWEWDGVAWAQRQPAHAPSPRSRFTLTYDATRQRSVMIGGFSALQQRLSEVWEWDGTDWTGGPFALPNDSTTANNTNDSTVRLGDDRWLRVSGALTWVGSTTVATVQLIGAGCGTTAVPALTTGGLPIFGHSFTTELHGIAQSPFLLGLGVGFGDVPIGGGCSIHLNALDLRLFGFTDPGGLSLLRLDVPTDPRLLGVTIAIQAAQFDAAAPLGIAISNGIRAAIGH